MTTNSGYFFAGSNAGGRTTRLWIVRPFVLVNVNSLTGCQSIADARSVLKCVSAVVLPVRRSMRTSSGGLTALSHTATATGAAGGPARWNEL